MFDICSWKHFIYSIYIYVTIPYIARQHKLLISAVSIVVMIWASLEATGCGHLAVSEFGTLYAKCQFLYSQM